jgi:hypothetical protein
VAALTRHRPMTRGVDADGVGLDIGRRRGRVKRGTSSPNADGTPRRAVLKRVCRSCFEPRRGRDPVGACSLKSQPRTAAGHSGDRPPDPETLRKNPPRLHHILIQGIMRCSNSRVTSTARCNALCPLTLTTERDREAFARMHGEARETS